MANFIQEMATFAAAAEAALARLEGDPESRVEALPLFSRQMLTIRGTALQLGLPEVAKIAGMGEEIAARASTPDASRPQVRKAVASLWDTLTTVKYQLEHPDETGLDEILLNRLESTLRSLGGRREAFGEDEIAALLASAKRE